MSFVGRLAQRLGLRREAAQPDSSQTDEMLSLAEDADQGLMISTEGMTREAFIELLRSKARR